MSAWAYAAAAVTGAGLSVSGAALQSVLRNPLAEPYLLGTVGGAATCAAAVVNLGWVACGRWVLPTASLVGSVLSLALVSVIAVLAARARRRDGSDPALRSSGSSIVLAGFATAGFTGSLDMLVMAYATPADFTALTKWLYGSLAEATPAAVVVGAAVLAVVFATLLFLARQLNVLELGRDEAETLGVNTRRVFGCVLAAVSLMTAVTVALAGAIGFIGLVVPHLVRRRTGPRMQRVLPCAAVTGGLFLTAAEGVRRLIPGEIPVGVVCALVGAPFLFVLLASRHNGEGWDV